MNSASCLRLALCAAFAAALAWAYGRIEALGTTKANPSAEQDSSRSELRRALFSCKSAFIGIAVFSGLINVLMLTGSLFMLEVYDRVLPSRSVPTLIGLSILTATLFAFQALLEITRGRLLVRAYPYVPIAAPLRIGVAIFSYNGTVTFGITGDHDVSADVDVLATGITTTIATLQAKAASAATAEAKAAATGATAASAG